MAIRKLLLLLFIILCIVVAWWFVPADLLSFASIKAQQAQLNELVSLHPWLMMLGFFLLYILITALSLPGAVPMTLLGGALFGLLNGLLLVSFASTIGATLAFLSARFILRDSLEQRFNKQLTTLNKGIKADGNFYLFSLRLVPLFPFSLINLTMGLTQIRLWSFYWVSQLGMLAGTAIFVNAGTQLSQLESSSGILSPALLASFVALGLFPLLAKKTMQLLQKKRQKVGEQP